MREVPVSMRQCLFPDETGHLDRYKHDFWRYHNQEYRDDRNGSRTPILTQFSKDGCVFECLYGKLLDHSMCLPWFFPRYVQPVAFEGRNCF